MGKENTTRSFRLFIHKSFHLGFVGDAILPSKPREIRLAYPFNNKNRDILVIACFWLRQQDPTRDEGKLQIVVMENSLSPTRIPAAKPRGEHFSWRSKGIWVKPCHIPPSKDLKVSLVTCGGKTKNFAKLWWWKTTLKVSLNQFYLFILFVVNWKVFISERGWSSKNG